MQASNLTLWSTVIALTVATNTSIHFYSDNTGCVNHSFSCNDLPTGYCCASNNPYCRWAQCDNCRAQDITTYQLPTYQNNQCSGDPSFSCSATTVDSCCPLDARPNQNPDSCSAKVVPSGSDNSEGGCLGIVEPNKFRVDYTNGRFKEVWLPQGTYQTAFGFAVNEDFDELFEHFSLGLT